MEEYRVRSKEGIEWLVNLISLSYSAMTLFEEGTEMKKRKLMSAILCAAMAGSLLAGCGGGSDTGPAAGTTAGADAAAPASSAETQATGTTAAAASHGESVVTIPTELTFIFADGDEGAKSFMNAMVGKFNERRPDITVRIKPGNGGAYSGFLKTKGSVGEFPDVMEMRDTAIYCRAGMF